MHSKLDGMDATAILHMVAKKKPLHHLVSIQPMAKHFTGSTVYLNSY
jgi:hypothetical protein